MIVLMNMNLESKVCTGSALHNTTSRVIGVHMLNICNMNHQLENLPFIRLAIQSSVRYNISYILKDPIQTFVEDYEFKK